MRSGGREVASAVAAFGLYSAAVLPAVRAEQRRWRERAAAIPDPERRALALAALLDKASNVEATAVFAILAPRRHRAAVVRAGAALQIAIDYLDSVDEGRGGALEDRLRLHRPLAAGFDPRPDAGEVPAISIPGTGGNDEYLDELLAGSFKAAATLPKLTTCQPAIAAAIGGCGEGQAHTHAAAAGDSEPLRRWAEALPAAPGYAWWEVAAGASSSVAAHALLALAADPATRGDDAQRVDSAYFPSIGALTVLLDDLADRDADASGGDHNYTRYYSDEAELSARLGSIADRGKAAVASLSGRRRHEAILAGVVGFYLASPSLKGASATRQRLLESHGAPARFLATATRLRGLAG